MSANAPSTLVTKRSWLGKLRVLPGREVCKILEAEGFSEVRQRGSHIVNAEARGKTTTTVPVPVAQVTPHDPASFASVPIATVVIALLASWIPGPRPLPSIRRRQ